MCIMVALKQKLAVWAILMQLSSPLLLLRITSSAGASWESGASAAKLEPPSHGHGTGAAIEPDLLYPVEVSGSMPDDYFRGSDYQGAWLEGKQGASRNRASYAALSRTIPAAPYWNQRVRLKALVSVRGVGGGAFAALFLRVTGGGEDGAPGPTLVLDNMKGRRIKGWQAKEGWWSVVVDVPPGPPDAAEGETCPLEGAVPAWIQFGFLLCAGRGHVMVEQTSLEVVPKDIVPVTGGMPPWEPPGPEYL